MLRLFLLLLITLTYLSACSDASVETKDNNVGPLRALQYPEQGAPLQDSQDIRIVFNKSMNTASLNLVGDISNTGYTEAWQKSSFDNDTLIITPGTKWLEGTKRQLKITVSDILSDNIELNLLLHVVNGVIYVSSTKGDDDVNTGSADSPLATIRRALVVGQEQANTTTAILVAQGDYPQDIGPDLYDRIRIVVAGFSLYGGYHPDDWSQRRPRQYVTEIRDLATSNTGASAPIYTDRNVDETTIIDGFTITGASERTRESRGIEIWGGAPVIKNNIIFGGTGSISSTGVRITNASQATILNNVINAGGLMNATSRGIWSSSDANNLIENNIIYGGTGRIAYGIRLFGSSATIHNNEISAGHTQNFLMPDEKAWGIYVEATSPNNIDFAIITNNIISGGRSDSTMGIYTRLSDVKLRNNVIDGGDSRGESIAHRSFFGALSDIQNNIVFTSGGTTTSCFDSIQPDAIARTMQNNVVFGCTNFYRSNAAVTDQGTCANDATKDCYLTIDALNDAALMTQAAAETAAANTEIQILFVDLEGPDNDVTSLNDNNWRLSNSSSCAISEGGLNGLALNWSFSDDLTGATRSFPWSIGAYENDICVP